MASLTKKSSGWKTEVTKKLTAKMLCAPEKRFDLGTLYINAPAALKKTTLNAFIRVVTGGPSFNISLKLQTSGGTPRWFATFNEKHDYAAFCADLRADNLVTFKSVKVGTVVTIEVTVQTGDPAPAPVHVPAVAPQAPGPARRSRATDPTSANSDDERDDAEPAHSRRRTHRGVRTRGAGASAAAAAAPVPPPRAVGDKRQRDDVEFDLEDGLVQRMELARYMKKTKFSRSDERQSLMTQVADAAVSAYLQMVTDAFRANVDQILQAASVVEAEQGVEVQAEADIPAAVASPEAPADMDPAVAAVELADTVDMFLEAVAQMSPTPAPVPTAAASPSPPRSAERRGMASKGGATAMKATSGNKIAKKEVKKVKKLAIKAKNAIAEALLNGVPPRRSDDDHRRSDDDMMVDCEREELEGLSEEDIAELMEMEPAVEHSVDVDAPTRSHAPKRMSDQDVAPPTDAPSLFDLLEAGDSPRGGRGCTKALHKTASPAMKKKATRGSRGGANKKNKKERDGGDPMED